MSSIETCENIGLGNFGVRWFADDAFVAANPIFFLDMLSTLAAETGQAALRRRHLLRSSLVYGPCLFGIPDRIAGRWASLEEPGAQAAIPSIAVPDHVIPVHCGVLNAGMMVPLAIGPADDWELPEGFESFAASNDCSLPSRVGGFLELLRRIEDALGQWHCSPICLRWRKAFSVRIVCPIHLAALSGRSLEVPLVVALLRAFSESPSTGDAPATLPFGNTPVFATGTLEEDGAFGPVDAVTGKLAGFLREYGPGRPAILTACQQRELEIAGLLDEVEVFSADRLSDLFFLEPFASRLRQLAEPPLEVERDMLLGLFDRLQRSLRFHDTQNAAAWLRSGSPSPFYAFRACTKEAETLLHRGMLAEARPLLERSDREIDSNPRLFGANERAMLAALWGSLDFDACDPEAGLAKLEKITGSEVFAQVSPSCRVQLLGTASQLHRSKENWDRAVAFGEQAVALAELTLASEAGRDRNYLIHALLKRTQSMPQCNGDDLRRSARLLDESRTTWSPAHGEAARRSHFGFCLHYEAEIHRLSGEPFAPPAEPPWQGHWGHPWMFVLLSTARNQANTRGTRETAIASLVEFAATEAGRAPGSLLEMFLHVYTAYEEACSGCEPSGALDRLALWCEGLRQKGFSGWQTRLLPIVERIGRESTAIEELCDAIPYH